MKYLEKIPSLRVEIRRDYQAERSHLYICGRDDDSNQVKVLVAVGDADRCVLLSDMLKDQFKLIERL